MAKPGRPTKYSESLKDRICERLASGESLRSICEDESMPVISTVLLWVVNNRDGFSEHYARAREAQAHHHVDEMLDMRHAVLSGEIEPNAARVVADIIKWTSERMARKSFSAKDQSSETLEVKDNKRTITITRATPTDDSN